MSAPTPPATDARPTSAARRLLLPVAVLGTVTAAFAYVGAVDPNEPGHYPPCPLYTLTGVLCPGCGGLRSAHAFAHADLATALGANAVAVLGYLAFGALWVLWAVRSARGAQAAPFPRPTPRPVQWWLLGTLLLAFSVVRNLPFGAFLRP
ncbi:DUF2752 domain-containing protein [Streptomyces sp. NPDC060194]|uniref:DUF2752 domain-containing protein n=1 Tax=Streptomyces sp. NPDC060194 TaxID=3347069 RepID=UPI003655A927